MCRARSVAGGAGVLVAAGPVGPEECAATERRRGGERVARIRRRRRAANAARREDDGAGDQVAARGAVRGVRCLRLALACTGVLLLTSIELEAATYYVRTCRPELAAECDDANDGKTPHTAWATIGNAATVIRERGNPGDVVLVGPGRYPEGDIAVQRPGIPPLPIRFRGDASGVSTGDRPGPVVVDAGQEHDAVFLVIGASDVVITGFHLSNARVAGVQVRRDSRDVRANRVIIANNVIFSNGSRFGRGVQVTDSHEALVFNNLIYGNTSVGIFIGGQDPGSRNARVISNTVYGNGLDGIVIGERNESASTGAWVINNIIADTGTFGIDVNSASTCDYVGAFNLVTDGYTSSTPSDPSDIRRDPLLAAPAGADGVLGGSGFADDDFALSTVAAGQARDSPALDAGSQLASFFGLQGSTTRTDGVADDGMVDLGFHEGNVGFPALDTLPIPQRVLYVRASGRDANDGLSPQRALRSMARALKLARAGTRIIVGSGTYQEGDIGPSLRTPAGPMEFVGDVTGEFTGDPAGSVVIDARGFETGFKLLGRCSTIVDGFTVTNAYGTGIALKSSRGSVVRNNVSVSNRRLGIDVINSGSVRVANNLVYANGSIDQQTGGGIQVGGGEGSDRAAIENNTVYANGANGILIGTGGAPSIRARVRYNVIQNNGGNGIQLDNVATGGVSGVGYLAEFNINADGYGVVDPSNCAGCENCRPLGARGCTYRAVSDLILDPLLVNAVGEDGILGGEGFADDNFSLSQVVAGQSVNSPAVDLAPITAKRAGLSMRTTRTDGVADQDALDLGYHAPRVIGSVLYVSPSGSNQNSGLTAERPLRTIEEALLRVPEGGQVIVAPGTYREANLRPKQAVTVQGPADDVAVVDAEGASTVFDVRKPDIAIRSVGMTGASSAAVRVRADGVQVVDCRVFSNADKGIFLASGVQALLFNNLVYANANTGIVVGAGDMGFAAATIANNTVYGNENRGITIGLGADVASKGASVVNNLIAENRRAGLEIGPASALGLQVGHNCNTDGYAGLRQPSTDVNREPAVLDPAGPDRLLGGIGMADDAFYLWQVAAGQRATSVCVDAGLGAATQLGLGRTSTRSDGVPDAGSVDVGYHYGVAEIEEIYIPDLVRLVCPGFCRPEQIDCNGDGKLTIDELVLAVNITLDRRSVTACASFDANDDGRVTIDELITGVRFTLS